MVVLPGPGLVVVVRLVSLRLRMPAAALTRLSRARAWPASPAVTVVGLFVYESDGSPPLVSVAGAS